jgi:hypothetical protein
VQHKESEAGVKDKTFLLPSTDELSISLTLPFFFSQKTTSLLILFFHLA